MGGVGSVFQFHRHAGPDHRLGARGPRGGGGMVGCPPAFRGLGGSAHSPARHAVGDRRAGGGAETSNIGSGGAIHNAGNLTLRECTISGCTSTANGGAIDNRDPGTLTIERSTLSGNTANAGGGAIQHFSPQLLSITSSTLANNTGGFEAGAINSVFTSPVSLIHCTISGNRVLNAPSNGVGGVRGVPTGFVTVRDSIISGNFDANSPGTPDIAPGFIASGQNLIGGDAKLALLADYGGDGQSNGAEITAGTDPANPASVFRIEFDNAGVIWFPTVIGRTYTLQRSDTLAPGSWVHANHSTPGDGDIHGFDPPFPAHGAPRRFYRIVVTQP